MTDIHTDRQTDRRRKLTELRPNFPFLLLPYAHNSGTFPLVTQSRQGGASLLSSSLPFPEMFFFCSGTHPSQIHPYFFSGAQQGGISSERDSYQPSVSQLVGQSDQRGVKSCLPCLALSYLIVLALPYFTAATSSYITQHTQHPSSKSRFHTPLRRVSHDASLSHTLCLSPHSLTIPPENRNTTVISNKIRNCITK